MDAFEAQAAELTGYLEALSRWPAGAIALETGEDASTAQLLLLRAAALLDLRIATGWNEGGRVLVWRREVIASAAA
jgi:hypothetical protein